MGYEAECTVRYDGRTSRGKAALETRELVFRGDRRLVIPLKEVKTIRAKDGWMTVGFGGQTAEFKLDAAAEKWAARIANPPSRLQKLGVKPAMVVVTVEVEDEAFMEELRASGATVAARVGGRSGARTADIVLYGASHRRQLGRLEALSSLMKPSGALWVIRPKGHPDITEAEVMAAGKRAGLVDVKVASFSETHTAEKFVIPVAKR